MNTKNFDHTIAEYRALQSWSDSSLYNDTLWGYCQCIEELMGSGLIAERHVRVLERLHRDLKELYLEFMKVNLGDDMPEALAAELKEMKRPMFNTFEEWMEAIRQKGGVR